jgi:hypothetical protein
MLSLTSAAVMFISEGNLRLTNRFCRVELDPTPNYKSKCLCINYDFMFISEGNLRLTNRFCRVELDPTLNYKSKCLCINYGAGWINILFATYSISAYHDKRL